jgi:homogentisate 1,2-dioxygenase
VIHRIARGTYPPKPHTTLYDQGKLAFEHCFTRQGFDGTYSIFYHRQAPHWVDAQEAMGIHPGYQPPEPHSTIQRAHFRTQAMPNAGSPFLGRELLMGNRDVGIWFVHADQSDPAYGCNADGDELVFVHQGSGTLETPCGLLPFTAGDYVFIPRSLVHRWVVETPVQLLVTEALSWIDLPAQFRNASGQLKMDAPYSHRDFQEPQWPEQGLPQTLPPEVLVKRDQHLTRLHMHPHSHPFDVLGWDGALWPFVFPIRAFQPKTGLVHLPPTIHGTFAGGGFLVCSFVPRLVDFHPQAIPCPYPHSSVDCDEFIFYVEGNFTSRRGIDSGSMTLHPRGLPHGPHPGTYEASIGAVRTDEMAVMIDTFAPLHPTPLARALEDRDYQFSWVKK